MKEKIVQREYTLDIFRAELKEAGKNLTRETIRKKLLHGEFGAVQWIDKDHENFIVRSNVIYNYINKPRGKNRPRQKKDTIKVLMPKYSEDEAGQIAESKIKAEEERKAKWTWNLDKKELREARQDRANFYIKKLMSECEIQEVDKTILMEEVDNVRRFPLGLLNFVVTRYENKSEQDYFIERYMAYVSCYKFSETDPKYDTILRNAIDEELLMIQLRQILRSPVGLFDDDVHKALSKTTDRWRNLLGGAGILLTYGKEDPDIKDKRKPKKKGVLASKREASIQ